MNHNRRVLFIVLMLCLLIVAPVMAQEEAPPETTVPEATEQVVVTPEPTEAPPTQAPATDVPATEVPDTEAPATEVPATAVTPTESVEVIEPEVTAEPTATTPEETTEPTPIVVTPEPTTGEPEVVTEIPTEPPVESVLEIDPYFLPNGSRNSGQVTTNTLPAIPTQGEVRVLIQMNTSTRPANGGISGGTVRSMEALSQTLVTQFGATVHHQFDAIPFMAATVNQAGLAHLYNSPAVATVQLDETRQRVMNQSLDMVNVTINAGQERVVQETGAGTTIAILDGMPRTDHQFYGSRVVASACFTNNGGQGTPGSGTCAWDTHGTHVTGTAAGSRETPFNGAWINGVAPEADIVAVGVFTGQSAYDSDILAGLNYVRNLNLTYINDGDPNTHPIAAVNLSLGGGLFTSVCDNFYPAYANLGTLLRNEGVAVVAASGNSYQSNAMSAPACVSNFISVGSYSTTYGVSVFSNETTFLDLIAPGEGILSSSAGANNTYAELQGTSMASPHVAGAFALLREKYPDIVTYPVPTLLSMLRTNGTPTTSAFTGRSYPLINLSAILNEFPLVSPLDNQNETSYYRGITLSWEQLQDFTSYEVLIYDPVGATTIYNSVVTANCNNGTCTFTPERLSGPVLGNVAVDWYVRAIYNGEPVSAYIGPGGYEVLSVDPIAPANSAFINDINSMDGLLTYSWERAPEAEFYQLYIANTAGTAFLNEWVPVSDLGCAVSGPCEYTPDVPITNGQIVWYVRPWKFDTYGAWTNGATFTMSVPAPQMAQLNQPNGLNTDTPELDWTAPNGATSFEVYLVDPNNPSAPLLYQTFTREQACGSQASVACDDIETPPLLSGITYHYYINAIGAGGTSGWAGPYEFSLTVPAPARPTNLADTAIEDRGHAQYLWDDDPNADWYELTVVNGSGVTIHQQWYNKDDAALTCSAGRCDVRPALFLTNQRYTWYVRAYGPGGVSTGENSGYGQATIDLTGNNAFAPPNANNFDVAGDWGALNTAIDISDNVDNPIFVWDDIPNANYYELVIVKDSTGAVLHQQWHIRLDVCFSGICQYQVPNLYLTAGTHSFYVRAYGPGGVSINGISNSGYEGGTFTVQSIMGFNQTRPIINTASFNLDARELTLNWDAITGATWYQIVVVGPTGATVVDTLVNVQNTCFGTCIRAVTADLGNGDHDIYIRGYGPSGYTDWSDQNQSPGNTTYQPYELLVDIPAPPAPTLIAPTNGSAFSVRDQVTFQWSNTANTTYYFVQVYTGGTTVHGLWYPESSVCTTNCQVTLSLPAGSYSWTVYTFGPGTVGDDYENAAPRSIVILE